MPLDYASLARLRQQHPAWRLLRSEHAPLVASFLQRVFVTPNVRTMLQADLVEALEDELFGLREAHDEAAFPRAALAYLNDWADDEHGWLRKFYRHGSDEPHFELTPATEKAITWLEGLKGQAFVGTESRLKVMFDLLREMAHGSEREPGKRIAALQQQRDAIDDAIARINAGEVPLLDDTALKDRFQQFVATARELLADFREVEHNFRRLDRDVRERITLWDGSKGDLLANVMGERDAIADSDQGRSFRAFWELLMSAERQQELSELLDQVLSLPAVDELEPDERVRRVHYDWLEAGEHAQRTVAQLSQQLRRFLDDKAWLENRRIMELLGSIEASALGVRERPGTSRELDAAMSVDALAPRFELPMERPLYSPPFEAEITDVPLDAGDAQLDASALFALEIVDRAALAAHVRKALQARSQVTLRELCETRPLERGLAELVTYLQLASETFRSVVDEKQHDIVSWTSDGDDTARVQRRARIPRVVFVR